MIPATDPETSWHPVKKLFFRFACLYFVLYAPLHSIFVPLANLVGLGKLNRIWDALVPWVGEHVLHLGHEIAVRPASSGDTTFHYVHVLLVGAIAVTACLVWSLIDRRSPHYRLLARGLTVAGRYYLASVLLTYGFAKIFQVQFQAPTIERLIQPFGESSPMGLAWTFLGHSKLYNLFTGGGEIVAALLLLFRRTTTLGGLLSLTILGNVVMMNFSYDLPVKLFSLHLLLLATILLAVDSSRLLNVLLWNRPSRAGDLSPYYSNRRGKIVYRGAKTLLIGLTLVLGIHSELQHKILVGSGGPRPPHYGLYDVETFILDGELQPPLTTEGSRWQYVFVEADWTMGYRQMDGTVETFAFRAGPKRLSMFDPEGNQRHWSYRQPSPGTLEIDGTLDGRPFSARLVQRNLEEYPLVSRGFHWVQEEAFLR